MAKTKNNNSLYIGIAVAVVVVIAIIVAVVVMNGGQKGGEGGSSTGGTSEVEYGSIDEAISYGDYDGMEKLSKAIQNGEMVGKVVKVDGIVSHPMSTYSVVQENEDGTQKIGTQFIIDGIEETDYPEDGDHIVITGEVVEKSPMYFVIKTTSNNVDVK